MDGLSFERPLVGLPVNLINLCSLILNLNAAIDAGETATLEEAKAHISQGDVFDWLRLTYKLDVGLLQDPDQRDGLEIVRGLQEICGGYSGQERRKWGIENNGLALLLAWSNELIQQSAMPGRI